MGKMKELAITVSNSLTVGELATKLNRAITDGKVKSSDPVTLVTMDGMNVVCHAFVDHVDIKQCIAGTDNDGIELSGQRWA